MKVHHMQHIAPSKYMIIGLSGIVVGLVGLLPYAYFSMKHDRALATAAPLFLPTEAPKPAQTPTLVTGKPVAISIPSLAINLEVADGAYNPKNGTWTLSRNKAHYALLTTQPNNESGNTLIYGHYRPEVFAKLRKLQSDAQVTVTTDNGYRFTYIFRTKEVVDPANTTVLSYEGKPRLTLQTCTGAWMQNRQLFYFDFVSYEKL